MAVFVLEPWVVPVIIPIWAESQVPLQGKLNLGAPSWGLVLAKVVMSALGSLP
jgi:hypothetical protein